MLLKRVRVFFVALLSVEGTKSRKRQVKMNSPHKFSNFVRFKLRGQEDWWLKKGRPGNWKGMLERGVTSRTPKHSTSFCKTKKGGSWSGLPLPSNVCSGACFKNWLFYQSSESTAETKPHVKLEMCSASDDNNGSLSQKGHSLNILNSIFYCALPMVVKICPNLIHKLGNAERPHAGNQVVSLLAWCLAAEWCWKGMGEGRGNKKTKQNTTKSNNYLAEKAERFHLT